MKNLFARFVREESGQDLIEYGLLIAIIAIGVVTILPQIGAKVETYFTDLNTAMPVSHK